jgi:hypothetical protein
VVINLLTVGGYGSDSITEPESLFHAQVEMLIGVLGS